MLIVSPIAGRMAGRIGSRIPLIAGAAFSSLAFALLAVAHSEKWQLYLASAILGVGIGLAFASMSNLIVEAVSSEQTGIATGMNTIMRTVGGALGTTIAASILAGSLAADGYPTEDAFVIAFALSAIALLVGVGASVIVPRHVRGAAPAGAPQRAASVLADDPA